jgi:multidrug resistance efflux pump
MTESNTSTEQAGGNPKRQRALLGLGIAFLLLAIASIGWWLLVARHRATTDNA